MFSTRCAGAQQKMLLAKHLIRENFYSCVLFQVHIQLKFQKYLHNSMEFRLIVHLSAPPPPLPQKCRGKPVQNSYCLKNYRNFFLKRFSFSIIQKIKTCNLKITTSQQVIQNLEFPYQNIYALQPSLWMYQICICYIYYSLKNSINPDLFDILLFCVLSIVSFFNL